MAPQSEAHHPLVNWRQAGIGIAALVAGAAMYVLERPAGLVEDGEALVQSGGALVGFLGRVVPDVIHPFAFAMLTGSVLRPGTLNYGLACLAWATIDLTLEVGQAPAVTAWLESVLVPYQDRIPGIDVALAYFKEGVFAMVNVLAVLFGAGVAWFVLQVTARRDDLHFIVRNS